MSDHIKSFSKKYKTFSNFYPAIVYLDGMGYPTVEHAYQASKSTEFFFRKLIAVIPSNKAGLAKARGQSIRLRSDWKDVQIDIMHDLLCQKFKMDPFKKTLIETGDVKIIEGNYWHDNIWGDCYCENKKGEHPECLEEGSNWLGRLLMDIRRQLIDKGNCYRRHS